MRGGRVAWSILIALAGAACSGDGAAPAPPTTPTSSSSAVDTTLPATTEVGPAQAEPSEPSEPFEPFEVAALVWSPCADQIALVEVAECAAMVVPRDHADPAGATIEIAVARYDTAADGDQIGSLVVNPGGPGVSGIDYLAQALLSIPAAVQARFDLVSFDPRGVGASTALECVVPIDDNVRLVEASDDAAWAGLVAEAQGFVADCTADSAELLEWVGTNAAARDLDLLRTALGDAQLTYVGYSYGTRLGATYAELFPDTVRAMVLDGALKPTPDRAAIAEEQAKGLDRAFEHFAAACDADADCVLGEIGPTIDVVTGLRREIAELGSFPTDDPSRVLTPGELELAVIAALNSQDAWPFLAHGLYVAEIEQDGSTLQALADSYAGRRRDGTYDGLLAVNRVIMCADDPERRTAAEQRAAAELAASRSEHFAAVIRAESGCLGIPPARDPLVVGPARGAAPILVVGTTGDPATPYEWAVELVELLETAVLFTVDAEGHTAYGSVECAGAAVDAYLIDLTVPEEGSSCADEAAGDVFLPPGESQLDQVIVFLDCLRDEGLDLPEIGVADLIADPTGELIEEYLDPGDADFVAATQACEDVIPDG